MSDELRLKYLIKYHHNLSIQYASTKMHSENSIKQLQKVETEIEALLRIFSY